MSYELLTRERHPEMYARLDRLVSAYHTEVADARFAVAWCTSWKADVDGRCTLGKLKRASDLDRELAAFDFVVLLLRSFWQDEAVSDEQRDALMDHELTHAAVRVDKQTGEPILDVRDRKVYRLRRHDLEEFIEIAHRYGCYKRDLEAFAAALVQRQAKLFDEEPQRAPLPH